MYNDDELIMISAIQHYRFCKRQCALIHIENIWKDNLFTAEGHIVHSRVHTSEKETRNGTVFQRGLPIRSLQHGIVGKCDLVEFHYVHNTLQKVIPIEYKRGKEKEKDYDAVQLCAQALCLEEMLNIQIPYGYLYYNKIKHRVKVPLDNRLRDTTISLIMEIRNFLQKGETPPPEYSPKCKLCSLYFECMPQIMTKKKNVTNYLEKSIREYEPL